MEKEYGEERGAFGLATEDGGKEMIDAPMLKQVRIPLLFSVARMKIEFRARIRRRILFA